MPSPTLTGGEGITKPPDITWGLLKVQVVHCCKLRNGTYAGKGETESRSSLNAGLNIGRADWRHRR